MEVARIMAVADQRRSRPVKTLAVRPPPPEAGRNGPGLIMYLVAALMMMSAGHAFDQWARRTLVVREVGALGSVERQQAESPLLALRRP
jgi:hypothetical protein